MTTAGWAIKMFLVTEPQATSILGDSPQESHRYEDSESNKEIEEISVTQAMRTHTGTIATSGMIFSAGPIIPVNKKRQNGDAYLVMN